MNLKPLTIVGLVGTAIWLFCVSAYVCSYSDWQTFRTLPLNSVGDFVAGITAPLAFWWLVLGYFQQGIELRQNVEALRQQSKETENLVREAGNQAEAIRLSTLHAGRSALVEISKVIISQIQMDALSMADKYHTSSTRWAKEAYFNGDLDAPVRQLLEFAVDHVDFFVMAEVPHIQKPGDKVIRGFERLMTEARDVDARSHPLIETFEYSIYGSLYAALCLGMKREVKFSRRKCPTDLNELRGE